ncbi:solute carrier family 25 member 44-like [Styela clava]
MKEGKNIRIIEWHDMDKKRFYCYGLMLGVSMRTLIYPMNLVKTRLQAQEGTSAYRGTYDAISKIGKHEGFRGFYRGFPISLVQVFAGQLYITTYETTKQTIFNGQSILVQHLLGGFMASTVSQTIMVPVDIVSQHQQISTARAKLHMTASVDQSAAMSGIAGKNGKVASGIMGRSVLGQAYHISRHLLRTEGLSGLYRGYAVSLCTYGLNSGFYWGFYYMYSELLESFLPEQKGRLLEALRISASGILGSATAIILTNPLDVVRTRYQLQVRAGTEIQSAFTTFKTLLNTEGYKGLTKGMTARIVQSSFSSWILILGYEYVKKMSLRQDKAVLSEEEMVETMVAFSKS